MERVAKLMAQRGLCSRREAERLIEAGHVRVDGIVVREQGCKASVDARIEIAPEGQTTLQSLVTVILNKPPGVVSLLPEPGQTPAWKLLRTDRAFGEVDREVMKRVTRDPKTLSVAGRLDRASRGLLVLTEDGVLARRVIGSHELRKLYRVRVEEEVTDAQIRKLGGPLTLDDKALEPMHVRRLGPRLIEFGLIEGRKHQIRRVCRHFGLTVIDLLREAVGPIKLGNLPEGHWRPLTERELSSLRAGHQTTDGKG